MMWIRPARFSCALWFLVLSFSLSDPARAGHFRDFVPTAAAPAAVATRTVTTCDVPLADAGRRGPIGGRSAKSLGVPAAAAAAPAPSTRYPVAQVFEAMLKVVNKKEAEIRRILSAFNSYHGTDFELAQVRSMLTNAYRIEGWHLEHTRRLDSAAVYGSTNVPLYTFFAHGVIPALIADEVWFRTPERTRTVYLELYKLFSEALPEGMIAGLHMVHEAKEVQYNNFANFYVLGTNKKVSGRERAPADLVIYTGSPSTARGILEDTERRLKTKPQLFPSFDQLFLGFGAGMNPFVVTPSAKDDLERVADQILLPAKMNSGQDCMVPNFYMVHEDILPKLVPILKRKVAAMKFGLNTDEDADYTALGLTKNFSSLETYRDHNRKAWINTDATIDPETKQVSPHLFVFEEGDFWNVELQEHYAPFFSIFPYRTVEDIKKMLRHHPVQAQSMYGVVEGGQYADEHTNEVVRAFRQNRHTVVQGDHLFLNDASNMPFGGQGEKSSIEHTIRKMADGRIVTNTGHRPALISTEAFTYFGTVSMPDHQPLHTVAEAQAELDQVIRKAKGDPREIAGLPTSWLDLENPLLEVRPTGLAYQRKVIEEEGLWRVMAPGHGKAQDREKLEFFFGSALVFPSYEPNPHEGTGLAIHPSPVGATVKALNQFRGRINPHLGFGYLLGMLDNNKKLETRLVQATAPGMMAYTETYADLERAGRLDPKIPGLKAKAQKAIAAYIAAGDNDAPARAAATAALERWLEAIFLSVQDHFPEGAFFKNFGEFATADLGTQVTSFASLHRHVVAEFVRRLATAIATGPAADYADPAFLARVGADPWEMSTRFVDILLRAPEDLLVQGRVPIARTELGFPMEFRVDFMDGESVTSKLRFSHEYLPEEAEEAARQLNAFFAMFSQEEMRHLAGGADIARLTDGTWVIIEFNFGANSGSLWPQYFPIDANQFITNLTGKPTPLIASLEAVYLQGLEEQRKYLLSRTVERELWWKASFADFSRVEAARWFRNRVLEEFRKNPSDAASEQALSHLKALYEGMASEENPDFEKLYASAENYTRRKLLAMPPVPAAKSAPMGEAARSIDILVSASSFAAAAPAPVGPLTAHALGIDRREEFQIPHAAPRTTRRSSRAIPRAGAAKARPEVLEVPGWAFQWSYDEDDYAAARQIFAYLMPWVDGLVRSGKDPAQINRGLEILFEIGQKTVDNFASDDRGRVNPIPKVREIVQRLKNDHALGPLSDQITKVP